MRRIVRLLGMLGMSAGLAWFDSARRRSQEHGVPLRETLKRDVTDFLTHRLNPVVMRYGLAGGDRSPYAILEHVGRTSGKTYRTPLYAIPTDEYVYVRLPFGAELNWVQNVRSAGHCRLQVHGTTLELDEPAIVKASESPIVPPAAREAMERIGRHYLRLHILRRSPGTLDGLAAEPVVESPVEPMIPGVPKVVPAPAA